MSKKTYRIELYYGYQECESGIYHAFDAVDPHGHHDDEKMAVKLSDTLDTTPDDANFHYNSIPVMGNMRLFVWLISRIRPLVKSIRTKDIDRKSVV